MGSFPTSQWVIVRLGPGGAIPSSLTGIVGSVTLIHNTATPRNKAGR